MKWIIGILNGEQAPYHLFPRGVCCVVNRQKGEEGWKNENYG